jgi:hypothetical protein
LPWRLQRLGERSLNRSYRYLNRMHHFLGRRRVETSVTIACGFHGKSGGVTAIANLANMLSSHYAVDFVTNPTSSYNSLLQRSVRMVDRPATDAPVMVCDVACDTETLRSAKARDQTVIVSCHALANAGHGFTPDYVRTKLLSADLVHFVSQIQQDSFNLADKSL